MSRALAVTAVLGGSSLVVSGCQWAPAVTFDGNQVCWFLGCFGDPNANAPDSTGPYVPPPYSPPPEPTEPEEEATAASRADARTLHSQRSKGSAQKRAVRFVVRFRKGSVSGPTPHEVGNVIVQDGIKLSGRAVVRVRGGRPAARTAALRILTGRWRAHLASAIDLESVTGQLTGSALARSKATRACFTVSLPIAGSQAQVGTVQLVGGTGQAKSLRITGTGRVQGVETQELSKIKIKGALLVVRGSRQDIPAGCGSRSL